MQPLLMTIIICLCITSTVSAHGGTDDIGNHQTVMAAIGMIAILLSGIYSLLGERAEDDEITELDIFDSKVEDNHD